MGLKSILKSVGSFFKRTAKNLDPAQAFVAEFLPEFADDLAAFKATLPNLRTSIFDLADHAQNLWKDAKGTTLSTSLATHLAQAAFNVAEKAVLAEAEKWLKK